MSKTLKALSLLVEKSIYGNKENNRASIFEAEKIIKQALIEKEEYQKKVKRLLELQKHFDYINLVKQVIKQEDELLYDEMILLEKELKGDIK